MAKFTSLQPAEMVEGVTRLSGQSRIAEPSSRADWQAIEGVERPVRSLDDRPLARAKDTAPALKVRDLKKSYVASDKVVQAVKGVSFEIASGDFYTLLGPSGCGKTTTLRCVAGLEIASAGRIALGGSTVLDIDDGVVVPPNKRDIGMVFQSYGIWPHMSVAENVGFPLTALGRAERPTRHEMKNKIAQVLETVQLAGYESRMATELSGGQQQRLALARALVREPKLLLLDEPLSNLDASLREVMRAELSTLQQELGVTTLYVTHDQGEALSMSSKIAVMSEGRIVQEGTPRQVYEKPSTRFVAEFVGTSNFIEGIVVSTGERTVFLDCEFGQLEVGRPSNVASSVPLTASIRPEHVRLHPGAHHVGSNSLPGVVERVLYLGDAVDCHVVVGRNSKLLIRESAAAAANLRAGDDVTVELPIADLTVLSDDSDTSRDPDDSVFVTPDSSRNEETLPSTSLGGDEPT